MKTRNSTSYATATPCCWRNHDMADSDGYCWRFGEHKGDPCPCGWTSSKRKTSEIRQYLKRQQDDTAQAVRETSPADIRHVRYLQGMHDAFCRVVLFLDTQEEKQSNDQ